MNMFGSVLAEYRKDLQYTQKQVADLLNARFSLEVKPGSISKWEKGQSLPNATQFLALCEIYKVENINDAFQVYAGNSPLSSLNEEGKQKVYEYADLLVRSGMYKKEIVQVLPFRRMIKLYNLRASAGTGQYLDSDAYEMIEVGDEVSSLADFGITLAGDSMKPRFVDGQTVWVHSQEQLSSGEIGIFYYDGDAYCKKYAEVNGRINLISLNPKYDPIPVNENKGFRIFGKVVG